MQIWEVETLHMSQLAGGWDFLTLSDWRCAPKSNNKWYYKQPCSCGEAACCCWCERCSLTRQDCGTQTDQRPEGAAETSPEQQDWCCQCLCSRLAGQPAAGTASLAYHLLVLIAAGLTGARDGSGGVSACRAVRAQQNVIFFGNELPKWQVAEVARGCTSPAVTAACLDLTPFPKLQIITPYYRAQSIALTHI